MKKFSELKSGDTIFSAVIKENKIEYHQNKIKEIFRLTDMNKYSFKNDKVYIRYQDSNNIIISDFSDSYPRYYSTDSSILKDTAKQVLSCNKQLEKIKKERK